jgi:2-methylisocitrate lyase-like PEP mutase family enzyme
MEKTELLLSLHRGKDLLVLPNFWDPIWARILAAKGPAIGSS